MADPATAQLHHGLLGGATTGHPKPQTQAFPGPQPITVVGNGTPEGVRFTVDAYGSDYSFGPSKFPRPTPGAIPPPGTKGLAMFSANSEDSWIVALFDWP